MATCKECIHYDICLFHITGNENELCGHFIHTVDVAPKTEIEILEKEIKALVAFKEYFSELYGTGLEIANWHENGALEPFDNFYEAAEDEYEKRFDKDTKDGRKKTNFDRIKEMTVEELSEFLCKLYFGEDCSPEYAKDLAKFFEIEVNENG